MSRIAICFFIFLALLPIWFDLGGVPVGARSDGRYAAISRDMVQNNHWLIPHSAEGPHLTKPPLTYWSEALCIKLFGVNAIAVRLPSAIAGSLVVLGTLLLGWKIHGRRVGLLAMGLVAVMPIHLILSRLTLTDGLLAASWLGILAGGYLCISEPRKQRWLWLLWGSMAIGWLTKGPVALIPLACVVCWLVAAGRVREIKNLKPVRGLLLSILPTAIWALAIYHLVPQASEVWNHEVGDRLAGGGSHSEGIWLFPVVLLAGMFPATCMLNLPWLNHPWRRAWGFIRRGNVTVYWLWAVLLPLVIFSIPSGKLPSYILPLCMPMAMLGGLELDRWLRRPAGVVSYRYFRTPAVAFGLLLATTLGWIAILVAAVMMLEENQWWLTIPFGMVPAACLWMLINTRIPGRRVTALKIVWLSLLLSVLWGEVQAGILMRPSSTPAMLLELADKTGIDTPVFATLGNPDNSLSFYANRFATRIRTAQEMEEIRARHPQSMVIYTSEDRWETFLSKYPEEIGRYKLVLNWPDWPDSREDAGYLLLVPVEEGQQ